MSDFVLMKILSLGDNKYYLSPFQDIDTEIIVDDTNNENDKTTSKDQKAIIGNKLS